MPATGAKAGSARWNWSPPNRRPLTWGVAQQLTDLGGDGRLCLVQYTDPLPGFYERTPDANWKPFQPFVARRNVAWEDPTLRFVDVTGDGLADVLIDADTQFVVFPSLARAGFGSPIVLPKPGDEPQDPALVSADAEQTIFLADMNGDGLSDIVRIRNGEVCYWPSLGYGRFRAAGDDGGRPLV